MPEASAATAATCALATCRLVSSLRWQNSAIAEYQEEGPAARVAATSATVYGTEQCESSQPHEFGRDTVSEIPATPPPWAVYRLSPASSVLTSPIILPAAADGHIIDRDRRQERHMPVVAARILMLTAGAPVDLQLCGSEDQSDDAFETI